MWFDIFKIQQGSFSTLVPKNLPKRRTREPCKDRLRMMLDKIGEHNNFGPIIINNSNSTIQLNKIDNLFSPQKDKWGTLLPPPIEFKFENFATARFPDRYTSDIDFSPNETLDYIPEHICCEFLKFIENKKTDYSHSVNYELSDDWSVDLTIKKKSDTFPDKSDYLNTLRLVLRRRNNTILRISSTFWLYFTKQYLSVEQKKAWVRIHGRYDIDKIWENWMKGITQPDSALSIIMGEYLTKEEVKQWFYNDIDLFWWFE